MSDTKKPAHLGLQPLPPRRLFVPIDAPPQPKPKKAPAAEVAKTVGNGVAVAADNVGGDGKRKPGRPVAEKPWEAEGISRIAWYRRGGRIKK